jgi:transcriptional regulator with XRE-family HTH domain
MRDARHMTTDAGRAWLGEKVTERRKELRLSKEEASRRAQINVKTWSSLEAGKVVRDVAHPGIEQAMQWARGSVEDVLDGNDPTILEPEEVEESPVDPAEVARLLDVLRRQFGDAVYDEAQEIVDRARANTERYRRNA